MAYVAPTWRNGGPPALDAAALQAISDAIVANQTKNTQQDSSISSMQSAISSLQSGGAKIATGSYTGTGTYGASNPNSITFPFAPKVAFLLDEKGGTSDYTILLGRSFEGATVFSMVADSLTTSYQLSRGFIGPTLSSGNVYGKKSSDGRTFSWYGTVGDRYQANYKGYTYRWIAFG